jgi:hypothetical protein
MRPLLFVLLAACQTQATDKATPGPTDTGSESDDTGDGPGDTDPDDTGSPPGVVDENPCEALGLPIRDFEDATEDNALYATASDLTLERIDGSSWTLSEAWTGCDSHLFIQDTPLNASGWPTPLWDRDVDTLMDRLPKNVQLFFVSDAGSESDRVTALNGLKEQFDAALAALPDEDAAWWAGRIHFLIDRSIEQPSWLGDLLLSPRWPVAIDRFQRIRFVGSFADYARYSSSAGWFEPNLSMAANEPIFYNFEAEREARLDAEGATVVNVFDGSTHADPGWSGTRGYVDVTLPERDEMATYDTLEYDLYLGCVGEGEYGTCPAWDYLVYLYLCDVETEENTHVEEACQAYVAPVTEVVEVLGVCTAPADTGAPDSGVRDTATTDTGAEPPTGCSTDEDCTDGTSCVGYVAPVEGVAEVAADTLACDCREPDGTVYETAQSCNGEGTGYNDCACPCSDEIGRWITTYHREGRWVHDASPLLPKLAAGGPQRFGFYTQQNYEVHLDFRLFDSEKAESPSETTALFGGGSFNANYNDRDPIEMDIPADAAKVELAYVISGHGQVGSENCAEFCVTSHHFTVNGTENIVALSDAGTAEGCMSQVDQGTVPNQYGTWWYGRSNWCPGREVEVKTIDITDQVALGSSNTFTYEGFIDGEAFTEGGANIRLNSWVTIHR